MSLRAFQGSLEGPRYVSGGFMSVSGVYQGLQSRSRDFAGRFKGFQGILEASQAVSSGFMSVPGVFEEFQGRFNGFQRGQGCSYGF